MRQDHPERGFTVIELMIVVVIIGVLAAVVVPSWMRETNKGKYDPEVRAMFSEIAAKEEAYKSETGNGLYLSAQQCPTGAPNPSGVSFTTTCINSTFPDWQALAVQETDSKIRCTYQVYSGCAGQSGTNCPATDVAGNAVTPATPAAPAGVNVFPTVPTVLHGAWYTIVAFCDMDGDSSTAPAQFVTTSFDNSIQKYNYGQ